ncbi:hypothetical protein KIH79_04375 [Bifidobacterium sp. 82T10]|uniref:Signal transduction histidine kinase n=1 Tax=Bifidobacterium miconis TaxID=2834435 RepID=A0ABS6WEM4_9BIFI|nr:hypothetical protein [Bifidobacterium miconis]MBW3092200.1 hypothetical protein [Bifidobacterium miconis]
MMFGQRIDKRLLWDWRTRVLLACASIPTAVETLYLRGTGDGGDATTLFALLSVVGCLLMALLPRIGGWAIVALWAARCFVPETTPLSILFCLLVAVTIMAYLGIAMALAAAIAAEAATAARIWLYPWDSSVFAIVCATAAFLMVALWLGSMMSWRERQEADELERAALLRRVADQRLAEQLHHSVANDLTTILLLACQLRTATRADGGERVDAAAIIERTAQESLAKVRTLIAGLDRAGDASHRTPIGHVSAERRPLTTLGNDELQSIAATYDERLHAHGLTGEIIVGGVPSCSCTAERRSALLDILHEIVGNMMKYADPAAGYCIVVTLAPGLATLSASNGIFRPAGIFSGGTGLDRCRHTAVAAGGEFTVNHDDSVWAVLLKLPMV